MLSRDQEIARILTDIPDEDLSQVPQVLEAIKANRNMRILNKNLHRANAILVEAILAVLNGTQMESPGTFDENGLKEALKDNNKVTENNVRLWISILADALDQIAGKPIELPELEPSDEHQIPQTNH